MRITLEIDSAPTTRAQEPLAKTIFDAILKQEYREPDSTFFGCWTWNEVECTKPQQEKIKKLLVEAYNTGELRYAGWAEE
jgi:hypothetical protein